VVLVDHAAEHLAAPHRRVERHDEWLVLAGWPLLPRLVRPMIVVMPGIGPQHFSKMALTTDQHPVRAVGPDGPYPAFGLGVRPGRSRRSLHDPHAFAGKRLVERGSELAVTIPDEEPERADPVREVHDQIAGLLGCPCTVRVPASPRGCAPPAGSLPP
jgi:hypothetical protein